MAVTQYIGARYVPKFYTNSLGTSEWTPNTQYEPLIIVTWNGNSYTSKNPVPASIGSPDTAPEYWASTGIYNQQVEEYRQDVIEYKAETDAAIADVKESLFTFKNRRLLFVGDSYALGWTASGTVSRFPDLVAASLGLSSSQYSLHAYGGAGFINSSGGHTYLDILNESDMSDPDTVTDVIVVGGYNDISLQQSPGGIRAAISAFIARSKVLYPNATVRIGFVGITPLTDRKYKASLTLKDYQYGANQYGGAYMSGIENCLHNYSWFTADKIHPNDDGQHEIARAVVNVLMSGSADIYIPYSGFTITNEAGISANWSNMTATVNNGTTFVTSRYRIDITYSTPADLGQAEGSSRHKVATVTNGLVVGCELPINLIPVAMVIKMHNAPYYTAAGYLMFFEGAIYISIFRTAEDGSGWFNFNAVDKVMIAPFEGSFDSVVC